MKNDATESGDVIVHFDLRHVAGTVSDGEVMVNFDLRHVADTVIGDIMVKVVTS